MLALLQGVALVCPSLPNHPHPHSHSPTNPPTHTHLDPLAPPFAGDQFALFEAITALAMLVRRFDFERAPDAPAVEMTTGATIHTTSGLWLSIKPRQVPEEPVATAVASATVAVAAAAAAAGMAEQRELALAFTDAPAQQQQQQLTQPQA
jgi:hypothetical protein